jgi:hypothetical protein
MGGEISIVKKEEAEGGGGRGGQKKKKARNTLVRPRGRTVAKKPVSPVRCLLSSLLPSIKGKFCQGNLQEKIL